MSKTFGKLKLVVEIKPYACGTRRARYRCECGRLVETAMRDVAKGKTGACKRCANESSKEARRKWAYGRKRGASQ